MSTTSRFDFGSINEQIKALGPYNGLDSESTTAALSAAKGKELNDRIIRMDILGFTRVYGADFQKTVSNAFKAYITNNNIGRMTVLTLVGYAYGNFTNYPTGFSGNDFNFVAYLPLNISGSMRIFNIDEFKVGLLTYNPD